jgi:hypothetical protein
MNGIHQTNLELRSEKADELRRNTMNAVHGPPVRSDVLNFELTSLVRPGESHLDAIEHSGLADV